MHPISSKARMNRPAWIVVAASLVLAGCAGMRAGGGGECRWPAEPVVIRRAADTVHLSWTFEAGQMPERVTPRTVPALTAFLDTVRARVGGLDARALLERQVAFYGARPDSASQGEAANGRAVLARRAGTLRPIRCVEALLVEHQAARFPMLSRPTEFQAVVLERVVEGRRWTRVYFAGSGAPWPPKGDPIFDRVRADRGDGWRAVAHLHNHPFLFDRGDIAGANAPSMTDVQFWRHLRSALAIEGARVTNGFATLDVPAAAFDRLRAAGGR